MQATWDLLPNTCHLPSTVQTAVAQWVSGTDPALVVEADESITWVESVIWAACIPIWVVVVDDPSYAIVAAFEASRVFQCGQGHCADRFV